MLLVLLLLMWTVDVVVVEGMVEDNVAEDVVEDIVADDGDVLVVE